MAEVTLPDPAAGRRGRQLGVCWGPGNFLLLHVKKSKAEQQRLGGGSGEESKVHEVRWDSFALLVVTTKALLSAVALTWISKLLEFGLVKKSFPMVYFQDIYHHIFMLLMIMNLVLKECFTLPAE